MGKKSTPIRRGAIGAAALMTALGLALVPGIDAWGATTISGPIDLGTADPFGVLAAAAVDNTGTSVIDGDVGVSPGTALGGFPPGVLVAGNAFHPTDGVALQAQADLDIAMDTAASLTPTVSGVGNLTGLSLVPGVYAGGELSLDGAGTLTLAGSASSVWVFTAESTLITGSASRIVMTGGASECNVFWLVGSSATFGTGTNFAGTVMAEQSITATTGTVVVGRLLAATAAVTLDTTTVTTPTGCDPVGTTSTDDGPVLTSTTPTDATVGTAYSHTYSATGAATISYGVTGGTLPSGLTLDTTTGVLAGTPTTAGTSTFTVTATNGIGAGASVISTIETLPLGSTARILPGAVGAVGALAATGRPVSLPILATALLLVVGGAILRMQRTQRPRHSR